MSAGGGTLAGIFMRGRRPLRLDCRGVMGGVGSGCGCGCHLNGSGTGAWVITRCLVECCHPVAALAVQRTSPTRLRGEGDVLAM